MGPGGTLANVSFDISANQGTRFSTVAQNVPVGLVNPNDQTVGTASTIVQYGNNQNVGIIVLVRVGGRYYFRRYL